MLNVPYPCAPATVTVGNMLGSTHLPGNRLASKTITSKKDLRKKCRNLIISYALRCHDDSCNNWQEGKNAKLETMQQLAIQCLIHAAET